MPYRAVDSEWIERVSPRPGERAYSVLPIEAEQVLEWLQCFEEHLDKPGFQTPDAWHLVSKRQEAGRTIVLITNQNEGALEMSYVEAPGSSSNPWELRSDFRVHPLSQDEAYRIALDHDDEAIARGRKIYNERHPRPTTP